MFFFLQQSHLYEALQTHTKKQAIMDRRIQVEGEGVASTKEQLSMALFELGLG